MLLTTIWIGLAGALLMFAGDMLLYYTPEDFSYGPKSSAEERINSRTRGRSFCLVLPLFPANTLNHCFTDSGKP